MPTATIDDLAQAAEDFCAGEGWTPPVAPPPPTPFSTVVTSGPAITVANPGNSYSATVTLSTTGTKTVTLALHVLSATAPVDDTHLDLVPLPNSVLAGAQTFAFGGTAPAAGDYRAQVRWSADGGVTWNLIGPVVAFTIANPVTIPPASLLVGDASTFEGGVGGWTAYPVANGSVAQSAAHEHSGAFGLKLTAAAAGQVVFALSPITALNSVHTGDSVQLVADVFTEVALAAGALICGVDWYKGTNPATDYLSTSQGPSSAAAAANSDISLAPTIGTATPANAVAARVWIGLASPAAASQGLFIDDVTPVDIPATVTPPPPPPPPAGTVANPVGTTGARSNLPYNEGMWPFRSGSAASFTSGQQYQETQQGRLVDIQMAAQYDDSWASLESPQILDFLLAYAPVPVLMLPAWPSSGGSWSDWASGANNAHALKQGQYFASKIGTRKAFVRFAWESNGNWYSDSEVLIGGGAANEQSVFDAGWHNWAVNFRAGLGAKASQVGIVYSISEIDNKGAGDPLGAAAPNVADFDVVGCDVYDHVTGGTINGQPYTGAVTTSDTVPGKLAELNAVRDWAASIGKRLSLDEVGLHHIAAQTDDGDDNPHFIRAMMAWIKANKDYLAWVNWFSDDSQSNVNCSLFSPNVNNNPNSKAAFLAVNVP